MATEIRTVSQTGGVRPAGHGGLTQVAPARVKKDSFVLATGSLAKYQGAAGLVGTARYLAAGFAPEGVALCQKAASTSISACEKDRAAFVQTIENIIV